MGTTAAPCGISHMFDWRPITARLKPRHFQVAERIPVLTRTTSSKRRDPHRLSTGTVRMRVWRRDFCLFRAVVGKTRSYR